MTRTIGEAIEGLRQSTEAAQAVRRDIDAEAARAEGRLVDLPEVRRRSREREWAARGIPARLWPTLHDGAPDEPVGPLAPKPWPALEAVGRFLSPAEPRTLLVLSGAVGTGKTLAAAWGAAWTPGARLVKAIDCVKAGLYPDDPGFWPRLHEARVLALDDLAVEPLDPKGFGLAALEDLIDRRYDAARKTIATTNQTPESFRARMGERVWRRVLEVGIFVGLTKAP